MDWLSHLADAPFANILFLAGLAFLAVGVLGKIAGKIEPDKIGRAASAAVGLALICVGLYLHVSGDHDKDQNKQASNINSASPSPTPDAGQGQNVTLEPVTPPVRQTPPPSHIDRRPVDQGGSVGRPDGQEEPVAFPPERPTPFPVRPAPTPGLVPVRPAPTPDVVPVHVPVGPAPTPGVVPVPPPDQRGGIVNYGPVRPVPVKIPRRPDTCKQGFVWREAVLNDHVCVTPETRKLTVVQNLWAARRRNPAGGPYGPDTCLQGYVWREAVPTDHVCVTSQDRQQAAVDNAQAPFRRE